MKRPTLIAISTLTVLLAVSALAALQLPKLRFDYRLERFFPLNDEDTRFFLQFQERFGGDNDYILIGLKPPEGVFDSTFLSRVDYLGRLLQSTPWHRELLSLTTMRERERNNNPFGRPYIERPWIHLDQPARYPADSIRVIGAPLISGNLISDDGTALAIQWWHQPQLGQEACSQLADSVRAFLGRTQLQGAHLAGKCLGQTTITRTIRRETLVFTGSAVAFIMLLLLLSYRSLWGVVIPLGVVLLSVLWTAGLMGLTDTPIDLISNVLPSMLLVIGLADAVHLLTHYRLYRARGIAVPQALKRSVREVGWATLLTTLTTALGFITLTTSTVAPLVDLGWLGVLGLAAALLITYSTIPALLWLLGGRMSPRPDSPGSRMNQLLARAHRYVMTHKRGVLLVSAAVLIAGGTGLTQLKVNHRLLQDLGPNHPQREAFQFFDRHFGGARGFELAIIPASDQSSMYSTTSLRQMARLDSFLVREYQLSALLSPVQWVSYAHNIYRGGQPGAFSIPSDSALNALLVDRLLNTEDAQPDPGRYLTEGMARVSARMSNTGSYALAEHHAALRDFLARELSNAPFRVQLTGTPHLLDLNTKYLARNILLGLLVAIGLIGVLFALMLGSVRLGIISLLPNLLPLILVGGLMGWLGIDLRISTAIVFILAFGISVDDSIHFLVKFRQCLQGDGDVGEAIESAYLSSGKAISLTSGFLLGGFLTLSLSSFYGTFYLGLLLSLTIAVAWAADLSLLPVLLWYGIPRFFDKRSKGREKYRRP